MLLSIAFKLLKFKSLTSLEVLANKVIKSRYSNWKDSFGYTNYIIEVHCQQPNKKFFIDLNSNGVYFNNSFLSSPDILVTCDGITLLSEILKLRQGSILGNINYITDAKIKNELKHIWSKIKSKN
jgi:hypothetical protein